MPLGYINYRLMVLFSAMAIVSAVNLPLTSLPETPLGDYAYPKDASRVNGLVKFFETLEDLGSAENEELKAEHLTLPEAAAKLHIMVDGQSLADVCSRYYKLISQPNIRNLMALRELVDEHSDDQEQPEANFLAKLASERQYDALGRMYAIFASLNSERKSDLSSAYSVPVQHDLLDCLEYLMYRHGRASDGLVAFISENRSLIEFPGTGSGGNRGPNSSSGSANSVEGAEATRYSPIDKYRPLIGKVKEIEQRKFSRNNDYEEWIEALKKIQQVALKDDLTMPKEVDEFLRDPEHFTTLKLFAQMISRVEGVKSLLEEFENGKTNEMCESSEDYVKTFNQLKTFVESRQDRFPKQILEFVRSANRQAFIYMRYLEEFKERKPLGNVQDYVKVLGLLELLVKEDQEMALGTGGPRQIEPRIVEFANSPERRAFIAKYQSFKSMFPFQLSQAR